MDINEVNRYLNTGSTKSICVDRRLSNKYIGFVRDVIILENCRVNLEFNTYGYDEGGLEVEFTYDNFNELINSLEVFIEKEIADWNNVNRTGYYPNSPGIINVEFYAELIKKDLASKCISIPTGWSDMEVLGPYWSSIYEGSL